MSIAIEYYIDRVDQILDICLFAVGGLAVEIDLNL
jgi:hypothetical protein